MSALLAMTLTLTLTLYTAYALLIIDKNITTRTHSTISPAILLRTSSTTLLTSSKHISKVAHTTHKSISRSSAVRSIRGVCGDVAKGGCDGIPGVQVGPGLGPDCCVM